VRKRRNYILSENISGDIDIAPLVHDRRKLENLDLNRQD
jgi:hypothetical protein